MRPVLLHGFGTSVRANGRTLEIDREVRGGRLDPALGAMKHTSTVFEIENTTTRNRRPERELGLIVSSKGPDA
jgi:hypothetical protein